LEDLHISNHPQYPQKLYILILKFATYFVMYIIAPICLYTQVIDPILIQLTRQIIYVYGIRVIVNLLIIFIMYELYKRAMSIIFSKLQFNLKKEWIDYLTFKEWKISYYKSLSLWLSVLNRFYTFFFKTLDYIVKVYTFLFYTSGLFLIAFLYFLVSAVICAAFQKRVYGFDVWNSKILLNYVDDFNMELVHLIAFFIYSLILTSFLLSIVGFLIFLLTYSIIKSLFPVKDNRVDTSDIPISFLENALWELETFDFSDDFFQKQKKKDQITQLISFALDYYIKVDDGNKNPDYTNLCYVLWSGHLSKTAKEDVLFRANGLYKKIDELCAKINIMNSEEEKNAIVHDLKIYLRVIKDRDLSKIEPIPYKIKEPNLTTNLIKAFIFLQKII
jgi:hypothetical protein